MVKIHYWRVLERLKQLWKIDVLWHYLEKNLSCFSIVFDLSCLELFFSEKILATQYKKKIFEKAFCGIFRCFHWMSNICESNRVCYWKGLFYYRRRWKIVWNIVTTRYLFIFHFEILILNMSIMVHVEQLIKRNQWYSTEFFWTLYFITINEHIQIIFSASDIFIA